MLEQTKDYIEREQVAWTVTHSALKRLTEKEREVCQLQTEVLSHISRNAELEWTLFQKTQVIKSLEEKCLRQPRAGSARIQTISEVRSASLPKVSSAGSALIPTVSKNEVTLVKQGMAGSHSGPTMPFYWENGVPSRGFTDTQRVFCVEVATPKPPSCNHLQSSQPLPLQRRVTKKALVGRIQLDKTPLYRSAIAITPPATAPLQSESVRRPAIVLA